VCYKCAVFFRLLIL